MANGTADAVSRREITRVRSLSRREVEGIAMEQRRNDDHPLPAVAAAAVAIDKVKLPASSLKYRCVYTRLAPDRYASHNGLTLRLLRLYFRRPFGSRFLKSCPAF